jgi:hypothetical protein
VSLTWARSSTKRCNQCWQVKSIEPHFLGRKPGHAYQDCIECRAAKSEGRRVANHRTGLPTQSPLRVLIQGRSGNSKLGPIPAVTVTASTCPPSCGQFNHGCYAESHILREQWRKVEYAGVSWSELCDFVRAFPLRQLWRYAVAGDLPGVGESIDWHALWQLEEANLGKRGFTFTHKRAALKRDAGDFTINMSADNLLQADEFAEYGPTVVVLPSDAPDRLLTPGGRKVVVCSAEQNHSVTCARCGLCAQGRKSRPIIGFRAHGLRKREVSERSRLQVVQ